ncbi:hypothetical protein C1H46_040389 [Malus baccata]|uniref:Uncharacterized protein n=1 Tax=Malus baccata TaxID=106549 RepID=A0A540KIM6_MALBA|nr:hypothetical protein C1H46_040389 [Malus baccata]
MVCMTICCFVVPKILANVGFPLQMKQLDGNLPSDFEEILNKYNWVAAVAKSGKETSIDASDSFSKEYGPQPVLVEGEAAAVLHDIAKNDEVGVQSRRMLKVRAALEEKLKQKGVFSSITPKIDKPRKLLKPLNGKLDSYDDFDDDTVNIEGAVRGLNNGRASKLSQLVANPIKSKAMMIYLGEMILGKGGENMSFECLQELESSLRLTLEPLFRMLGMWRWRIVKLEIPKMASTNKSSTVPSLVDTETVDGKRHITYQLKRQKAVKNRKGQVREVRKPLGGINAGISRSTRFKN